MRDLFGDESSECSCRRVRLLPSVAHERRLESARRSSRKRGLPGRSLAEYLADKAAAKVSQEERKRRCRERNRAARYAKGGLTWEDYVTGRAAKKRLRQERIAVEAMARKAARAVNKRTIVEKRAMEKAWREANRERNRELQRAWKKRNPEKVKARKKARSKRLRAYLFKLQRGKCTICGTRLGRAVHVDHIIPLSRGGSNARSNLQLTHAGCNLRKSAKDPVDHARELGRLL